MPLPLSVINIPVYCDSIGEINFPFTSRCQLEIASWLGNEEILSDGKLYMSTRLGLNICQTLSWIFYDGVFSHN